MILSHKFTLQIFFLILYIIKITEYILTFRNFYFIFSLFIFLIFIPQAFRMNNFMYDSHNFLTIKKYKL